MQIATTMNLRAMLELAGRCAGSAGVDTARPESLFPFIVSDPSSLRPAHVKGNYTASCLFYCYKTLPIACFAQRRGACQGGCLAGGHAAVSSARREGGSGRLPRRFGVGFHVAGCRNDNREKLS